MALDVRARLADKLRAIEISRIPTIRAFCYSFFISIGAIAHFTRKPQKP
jgi:hypothetical protein